MTDEAELVDRAVLEEDSRKTLKTFIQADPKPPHTKSLCNAEWGAREIDQLFWEGLGRLLSCGFQLKGSLSIPRELLSSGLELNPGRTVSPKTCILTDSWVYLQLFC